MANCILLYSKEDERKLRRLIKRNTPSTKQIKAVLDLLRQGVGKLIYMNVKRIANDLKLDEVLIRLILHHLERMGAIKTYFRIYRRAEVRMQNADVKSLKYYQQDAEEIIRNAYFKKYLNSWIDLEVLSSSVQISIPRINNVLRELKIAGIIELEERDFCTPIKLNPGIKDVDMIELLEIFRRLEESNLKKVENVVEYLESEECKRKFILNYFGEDHGGACNACSVCNSLLRHLGEGVEAGELGFASVGAVNIGKFKKLEAEEKMDAGVKDTENLKKQELESHSAPWVLGEARDPKKIPKLIEFTKSENGNERRLAVSALGKLSIFKPLIFEAVPSLIELLEDDKPQVRQYAAKAFGKIGSEDALPHLKRLLNDEKPYVREVAIEAIKRIKNAKRKFKKSMDEKKLIIIYSNGASKGNPGAAGIGIVICDESGRVVKEHEEFIGAATNNVAEYQALIKALELACPFLKIS